MASLFRPVRQPTGSRSRIRVARPHHAASGRRCKLCSIASQPRRAHAPGKRGCSPSQGARGMKQPWKPMVSCQPGSCARATSVRVRPSSTTRAALPSACGGGAATAVEGSKGGHVDIGRPTDGPAQHCCPPACYHRLPAPAQPAPRHHPLQVEQCTGQSVRQAPVQGPGALAALQIGAALLLTCMASPAVALGAGTKAGSPTSVPGSCQTWRREGARQALC